MKTGNHVHDSRDAIFGTSVHEKYIIPVNINRNVLMFQIGIFVPVLT